MIPANNYVIIEPLGYNPVDKAANVVVNAIDEKHLLQSRVGKVLAVCDRLQYDGAETHTYLDGRDLSFHEQNYVAYLNQKSVYYDVPIEVKAGDTVLYRWLANTNTTLHVNGLIVLRYDDLVATVDEGEFYPLNGLVLMCMEKGLVGDEFAGKIGVKRSVATVVAEGCLVNSYLAFPDEKDQAVDLMGRQVIFDHRMAVRVEHDNHRYFDYDSEYPYYMIRRKDIHAYE